MQLCGKVSTLLVLGTGRAGAGASQAQLESCGHVPGYENSRNYLPPCHGALIRSNPRSFKWTFYAMSTVISQVIKSESQPGGYIRIDSNRSKAVIGRQGGSDSGQDGKSGRSMGQGSRHSLIAPVAVLTEYWARQIRH